MHETAIEIAESVRAGERKAVEVLDACLADVAAGNERLNAFVHLDEEQARASAEAVDAAVARGVDPGPYAGVPFGVKDLDDCAGMPTSHGSLIYKGRPPAAADSIHVARLRAAGGVPIGKTAAPEFGTLNFTKTKAWGITRNAWDPSPHAGRLVRRQRGGGGGGPGPGGHGQRRRRIHPHPRRLLGPGRAQAQPRAHPASGTVGLADRRARHAHHHRGRQRAPPRHHRRPPRRRPPLAPRRRPPLRGAHRVASRRRAPSPLVGGPRLRGGGRRRGGSRGGVSGLRAGHRGRAGARRQGRPPHRSRAHLAERRRDGPVVLHRGGHVAGRRRRPHPLLA